MDVPIIFTVRKQSQRCPEKVLRPFYQGQGLTHIAAKKYKGNPNVYIAAHEPEFKQIAEAYQIGFIQRSLNSALSEEVLEIHEHLFEFEYDYICQVNVCCPLLHPETVFKAIQKFQSDSEIQSLFSVTESTELIFDSNQELINLDRVFNSKIRRPYYLGNNAIMIYSTNRLFREGAYWNYDKNDPYLFLTSKIESIDIDTVEDFEIAQALYVRYDDRSE